MSDDEARRAMTPREMAESALRHEHDDIKGLAYCLLEALDEIERLRDALRQIAEHPHCDYCGDPHLYSAHVARAALNSGDAGKENGK